MKLYNVYAVEALARRKALMLDLTYRHPRSHPLGSYWDRLNPVQPPVEERDYVPPEGASSTDLPVEKIIWAGEFVRIRVNLEDACLLYQVSSRELVLPLVLAAHLTMNLAVA